MKFLCDHMLGTLAKWLRFLGHDAAYPGPIDDRELEALAGREGRVLLTRDRELAARVPGSVSVLSDDLDGQLLQVLQAFDLKADIALTRCSVCNAPLREASVEEARGSVPEKVLERQREFWHCDACGRFYWQGSHWDNMTERVRNLKARAGRA